MKYQAYYLIRPKPEFISHLRTHEDQDVAEILKETVLLENDEGGVTLWKSADHELRMKILWLASIRELTPLADDAGAIATLGSASISAAVFDRCWTIERYDLEDSYASLRRLLLGVAAKLEPTGNDVVDRWLSEEAGLDLRGRR